MPVLSCSKMLDSLRAAAPVIQPSLLLCDFGNLEQEIRRVEAAGAKALHLDIMDGHFVPNLTYGPAMVETVRRISELPIDVHLMIANPAEYLGHYIEAGANLVTIHAEAVENPEPLLQEIRELGAASGLAINPPTPVSEIEHLLPSCDMVLAMSVMPGFGGQEFDQVALAKLRELRKKAPEEMLLQVDGGVNTETAAAVGAAGAQMLVVGSAIFRTPNYQASMSELRQLASHAD